MTSGRAFVFGDDIDTDVLAPGRYMSAPIETLARHCLEAIDSSFADAVKPGDIVVAGANFGIGSSREQAAQALKTLGVAGVVARSFGGIFHRNAINLGLPVFTGNGQGAVEAGDKVEIDAGRARLVNHTRKTEVPLDPLPPFLLEMLSDGGLVAHLEKRFKREKAQKEART
jgi:3-isopropylmalate/(R)-2-methylmalate dehydratase small subunit